MIWNNPNGWMNLILLQREIQDARKRRAEKVNTPNAKLTDDEERAKDANNETLG
jgi:hypothetical protein